MSEERSAYRVKGKSGFMNNNTRNAFAAYGLNILKRSVLLVLYEQPLDYTGEHRDPLTQKDIRKQLGLQHVGEGNHLIRGVLEYLKAEGNVDEAGNVHHDFWKGKGRWRITEKGESVIEG